MMFQKVIMTLRLGVRWAPKSSFRTVSDNSILSPIVILTVGDGMVSFIDKSPVTLGDVIDPTQIIEKPSLSPKLSPLEILRIMDASNR